MDHRQRILMVSKLHIEVILYICDTIHTAVLYLHMNVSSLSSIEERDNIPQRRMYGEFSLTRWTHTKPIKPFAHSVVVVWPSSALRCATTLDLAIVVPSNRP